MAGNCYTFKVGDVHFFALDSNYMDPDQVNWLTNELKKAGTGWKIPFFHHPLYSSAHAHGSSIELRKVLEPLFVESAVQMVFSGHDHVYERMKPQKGILYFVEGASGELRPGDLGTADFEAKGFDRDRTFMVVEIAGDQMYFDTISRDRGRCGFRHRLCHGSCYEFTARCARPEAPLTRPLKSEGKIRGF